MQKKTDSIRCHTAGICLPFVRNTVKNFVRSFRKRPMLLLTAAVFSVGCSAERYAQLTHLKGTLAWQQSDWNNSVVYFCEAEDLVSALPDTGMQNYIDFALASAYLMQGENEAAGGKLQNISETAADILKAQRFYQQGIIAFRAKEYANAASLFRESLKLSGTDIDAKINYELSKKLCDKQQEMQHRTPQNAGEESGLDAADSIILDIIRKREQFEWKKIRQESEPSVNDY